MNIDILSDIHADFWHNNKWKESFNGMLSEILICAGDIGEVRDLRVCESLKWICQQYKQVFYVPGNHDSYNLAYGQADVILKNLNISNLTILKIGDIHQLGDYKIIGDTGWMPNHPNLIKYPINDLRLIKNIRPAIHDHYHSLRKFIDENADEKTIVVIHHIPTWKGVSPKFVGDNWNFWFVGDIEDLMTKHNVPFVISGHTHDTFDFNIGSSRYLCNPSGYPMENNNVPKKPVVLTI